MKKIEECLDLVLKALVNNEDSLCIYEVDDLKAHSEGRFRLSLAYDKLFTELALNKSEVKQLLEILKKEEYVDFDLVVGVMHSSIWVKLKSDNSIGNTTFDNTMSGLVGKPNKILITLKGKFFIINEGGYSAKLSRLDKIERDQREIQKGLTYATIVLAVGTLGLLLIELLKFFAGE